MIGFTKYKLECKNCSEIVLYQFGVVFLNIFRSSEKILTQAK